MNFPDPYTCQGRSGVEVKWKEERQKEKEKGGAFPSLFF